MARVDRRRSPIRCEREPSARIEHRRVERGPPGADVFRTISDNRGFQRGRLKYVLSLADERNPCAPTIPAAPEAGFKGLAAPFSQGFWVPAKTPAEVIAKLNEAFNASLKNQAAQDYLKSNCSSPVGGAPRVQAEWLRSEHAYWAEAARISKFEPE